MKIYAIFDAVVGEYGDPFYQKNDPSALRAWAQEAQKIPQESRKDFALMCIGTFDREKVEHPLIATVPYVVVPELEKKEEADA